MLDNTQYDKRFTNRNKIATHNGWMWISVPINKEHKFLHNKDVGINNNIDWRSEHWRKIFHSYINAKFFKSYENYFKNVYQREWELLYDLNFEIIKKIIEFLRINVDIIEESELKVTGKATEKLVNICKKIGADSYISGTGARDYMDSKLFEKNNIEILFQNYSPTQYKQYSTSSFIPDLSIIDMLANVGERSYELITTGKSQLE